MQIEAPPPGARPGVLPEPGPQRSDRSRRHFSEDCLIPRPAGAGWGVRRASGLLRTPLPHSLCAGSQEEVGGEGEGEEVGGGGAEEDAANAPPPPLHRPPPGRGERGRRGGSERLLKLLPLVAALVVDNVRGTSMAGFPGFALRAVFLPSAVRPKMLDTLAVTNQKDSYQWPVHGWYCWLLCYRVVFPFIVDRPSWTCCSPPVETPQVQFLDEVTVITISVVQTVQTVWKFRSCSSSRSLTFPVVTPWLIPVILATTEIAQLRVDKVVDAPFYAGADFLSCCRGRFPAVQTFLRTTGIPQLQLIDKVFDVSVVHVQQTPRCSL